MKGHIMILAHIMAFLWPSALTIDSYCNFKQKMELGATYYIYHPGYPNDYKGRHSCQWLATSPLNSRIQLYCETIDLPLSSECEYDRLTVSTTGTTNLQDGHFYCGSGKLSINSESNAMNIGFFSAANTPGGKFVCTIKAFTTENQSCDCGWHNTRRIVGGEATLVNEYPMMAALMDLQISELFCGATIIANNYAVTAAHCLAQRLNGVKTTGLLVGDWNVDIASDTPASKIYEISKYIVNQNYVARDYLNDIALVKTSKPIVYTLEVGPVCLPLLYRTANFEGQAVTVLGWGATGFGDAPSSVLQKVDLDWIPLQTCRQSFKSVTENQFCTYRKGKDSCQGDSGGPALWQYQSTSRIQFLGVISYGSGCALDKSPGTNTRVSQYINWIMSQTPEVSYCSKM